MTGDEFTARYRLREQLTDGDIVSYLAADGHGGTAFVHVFRGESAPEFEPSSLDAQGSAAMREVLDVEGIRVVVTEVIDPFTTFEEWAAEHQRAPEAEGPGAFTRIFRVQPAEAPPPPGPAEPESAVPGPTPPDGGAGPSGDEPREIPEEDASPMPPPAVADEPEAGGAGAFTRAFGALRAEPPPPASEEAPAGPPMPPPPPPEPSSPPPAPSPPGDEGRSRPPEPPEPPGDRGTGTFTRIMGAVREGPGTPPPPPDVSPRPPAGGAPPPPPPGAPPPRPGGPPPPRPGGFTAPPRPAAPSGTDRPPQRPDVPPPPPGPPAMQPPAPFTPPPPPGGEGGAPGPYTQAMRAYRGGGQSPSPSTPPERGAPLDPGAYGETASYLDRLQDKPRPEDTSAPRRPAAGPPPPPSARPGVPPVPSGPSDYTRVIRGAGPPSLGRSGPDPSAYGAPPPAPAPPSAKGAPTASRTPIIVALVATIAVLVAVILFFALRSG